MNSVFSFNNQTDLSMGINVVSVSRSIKPYKRNIQTVIAGRSGTYDTTTGAYDNTTISMTCMYVGQDPPTFARSLAVWLKDTGSLVMADEPDKTYTATAWVEVPEEYVQSLREFTIEFTCQPLARSDSQQIQGTITTSGGTVSCTVLGTAPTPCRIIIKNAGTTTIRNLQITHAINA